MTATRSGEVPPGAGGEGQTGPSDLAGRMAGLSAAKRALLERRLMALAPPTAAPAIRRRAPGEPAPLSFAQGRLWFLEQLCPGTNAWNSPLVWTLRGPLDTAALAGALARVVARHATLRTVFAAPGGRPEPVTLDAPGIELDETDLSAMTANEQARESARLVHETVGRPFDIARELLIRAGLIRLGDEEHVLVLVAHHIACDGWSKGLLVAELSAAYGALAAGAEPRLPQLEVDYGDYAAWQREQVAGPARDKHVEHWRRELADRPAALRLPVDHPRPARQTFRGAIEPLAVGTAVVGALDDVAASQSATRFMALLAAFAVLLAAHADQEDIVIGAPAAMRDHPELAPLIGFFANTLPYRIDLSGRPTYREVVARARRAVLRTLAHRELPFEQIVQAINPSRDMSATPLVQVSLRVEGPEPELALDGVRAQPWAIDPGIARFDLAVELSTAPGGLAGYLEYSTALFEPGTARTLAADLGAILEAVGAAPDLPIGALAPVGAIAAREGRT